MSNYPPPQYGGGYGSRDQSNMPYLPPAYPQQYYSPNHSQGGQAQMGSAANYNPYGYNHAVPAFGPIPTPGISPVPLFQGWNTDPAPLPAFSSAPHSSAYNVYNTPQEQGQNYPSVNQTAWSQSTSDVPVSYSQQGMKEGEYQTHLPSDHGVASTRARASLEHESYRQSPPRQYADNRGSPNGHSRSSGINYSPPNETLPTPNQRRSDSYSPHLSPITGNHVSSLIKHSSGRSAQPVGANDNETINQNAVRSPVQHSKDHVVVASQDDRSRHGLGNSDSRQSSNSTPQSRSLEEGKKKAKGAIMNLVAYDVTFTTMITEGLREDVVTRLYNELTLPLPQSTSNGSMTNSGFPDTQHAIATRDAEFPAAATKPGEPHSVSSTRLNGNVPISKASSATNVNANTAPKVPSSMSEKDRKIQAKLEEFKKMKEARSQKQAAEKATKMHSPPLSATAVHSENSTLEKVPVTKATTNTIILGKSPDTETIPQKTVAATTATNEPQLQHSSTSQMLKPSVPIPGLFLASGTSNSASMAVRIPSPAGTDQSRKRQLAADSSRSNFASTPSKRPFGHSRSQTNLVINVSDDEDSQDEDVAMDIDSDANQDSPTQTSLAFQADRTTNLTKSADRPDFLSRKLASSTPTPNNSLSTASILSSSLKTGPIDLQSHESAIEELKRLIAEKEARRRLKETPSGTQTPNVVSSARPELPASSLSSLPSTALDATVLQQSNIKSPPQDTGNSSSVEAQSMDLDTPESDSDLSQAVEDATRDVLIMGRELEKKEIAAQELQAALEKLRADSELALKELQSAKDRKSRLQARKKRRSERQSILGQETSREPSDESTVPHGSMQRFETNSRVHSPRTGEGSPKNVEQGQTTEITKQVVSVTESSSPDNLTDLLPITEISNSASSQSLPDVQASHLHPQDSTRDSEDSKVDALYGTSGSSSLPSGLDTSFVGVEDADTADQGLPPTSNSNTRAEIVSPEETASGNDSRNIISANEEDHVSDPIQSVAASADSDLEATLQEAIRAQADSPSQEEDASDVEMALSSPSSNRHSTPSESSYPQDQIELPISSAGSMVIENEEDYEPPEAIIESHPFSPTQSIEDTLAVDEEVMSNELQLISDDSSTDLVATQPLPIPLGENALQEHQPTKQIVPAAGHFFTPYESPLKRFHAFRFHPQFRDQVAGGLRSLTYSNKIEENNELCRYESLGGICNDSTCSELHFKDMNLPDDAILTALGSPDQFVGSRREEFCTGLRALLVELRKQKIRDFNVIAPEILAYRAKFLADDSKVLPLEGVTL